MVGTDSDMGMVRWAVNTEAWQPEETEWEFMLSLLPEEEAAQVGPRRHQESIGLHCCRGLNSCSYSLKALLDFRVVTRGPPTLAAVLRCSSVRRTPG